MPFAKNAARSISATPDGKLLYIGDGDNIWTMPVEGGQPRMIRAGYNAAVDPDGRYLLVQVLDPPRMRLFAVSLDGQREREIPLSGSHRLTFDAFTSAAISRDGRLLAPLTAADSWYFVPGVVDLKTGKTAVIPVDQFGDYHFVLWGPDGRVLAGAYDTRFELWRFRQQ